MVQKKKIGMIILAIVILVGMFATFIIANHQEVREKVIQAFSGEMQNAEENEIYAEVARIGDKAIISSAKITDRKTGTGPWDENDEPGNDSSATNDIVRSFDQVTWTIEATMGLKEDAGVDSITGGVINIEATLPEECANVMKWDLD